MCMCVCVCVCVKCVMVDYDGQFLMCSEKRAKYLQLVSILFCLSSKQDLSVDCLLGTCGRVQAKRCLIIERAAIGTSGGGRQHLSMAKNGIYQ